MAASDDDRPGTGWYDTNELLAFFGCSRDYFNSSLRQLATNENEVRKVNGKNYFHAPTLIRNWKNKPVLKNNHNAPKHLREGSSPPTEEELLLTTQGADSGPAIERYRHEKFLLARLDRREREGVLMRRDAVHFVLSEMAGVWRDACDRVQRQAGPDVHEILADACVAMEKKAEAAFVLLDEKTKKGSAR